MLCIYGHHKPGARTVRLRPEGAASAGLAEEGRVEDSQSLRAERMEGRLGKGYGKCESKPGLECGARLLLVSFLKALGPP